MIFILYLFLELFSKTILFKMSFFFFNATKIYVAVGWILPIFSGTKCVILICGVFLISGNFLLTHV